MIIIIFTEAQLSGTLLVDVVADDEVQVFWSIFGGNNTGVSISYTVSNHSIIMSSI